MKKTNKTEDKPQSIVDRINSLLKRQAEEIKELKAELARLRQEKEVA